MKFSQRSIDRIFREYMRRMHGMSPVRKIDLQSIISREAKFIRPASRHSLDKFEMNPPYRMNTYFSPLEFFPTFIKLKKDHDYTFILDQPFSLN